MFDNHPDCVNFSKLTSDDKLPVLDNLVTQKSNKKGSVQEP